MDSPSGLHRKLVASVQTYNNVTLCAFKDDDWINENTHTYIYMIFDIWSTSYNLQSLLQAQSSGVTPKAPKGARGAPAPNSPCFVCVCVLLCFVYLCTYCVLFCLLGDYI